MEQTGLTRARNNTKDYPRLRFYTWLWAVFVSIVLLLFIFTFCLNGIKITTSNMAPTLASGDIIIFERLSKHISMPRRGDIVVYNQGGKLAVGRIIALPNERITVSDSKVYINDFYLDESAYMSGTFSDMEEVTLEKGEFFIATDARESISLSDEYNTLDISSIKGRALFRVWPHEKIALFK